MKNVKTKLKRNWYLINAENKVLGRISGQIAKILQGKHKPNYSPEKDMGDFVIVINCQKIELTGRKKEQKIYYRHSGWMGGIKETPFKEMLEKKPTEIIKLAVWGMLPKNKTRKKRISRLKIYPGSNHLHKGQNPKELKV